MNKDFDLDNEFISKPKQKLNYRILILMTAMVGFAFLSWSAYKAFAPDEEVYDIPLIESDTEITKIKPLDPGGIHMSNMDKDIYNNISQENSIIKEKLLPPPEEPITSQTKINEENLEELLKPLAEEIENITAGANEVKRDVSEVTLHEDVSTKTEESIKEEKLPEQTPEVINVTKKNSLTKIVEKKPSISKTSVGKYRIQLASMKSEKDATKEWLRLKAKHKSAIGTIPHSIEKRNIGNKGTYYCIHAGAFKNYNAAHNVCKQLIAKKQNCIVLENK
jgi:hypothetical protein